MVRTSPPAQVARFKPRINSVLRVSAVRGPAIDIYVVDAPGLGIHSIAHRGNYASRTIPFS